MQTIERLKNKLLIQVAEDDFELRYDSDANEFSFNLPVYKRRVLFA